MPKKKAWSPVNIKIQTVNISMLQSSFLEQPPQMTANLHVFQKRSSRQKQSMYGMSQKKRDSQKYPNHDVIVGNRIQNVLTQSQRRVWRSFPYQKPVTKDNQNICLDYQRILFNLQRMPRMKKYQNQRKSKQENSQVALSPLKKITSIDHSTILKVLDPRINHPRVPKVRYMPYTSS